MLARVTRGSSGLSDYLISGKRKDSKLTRDEKDKVTSLYGDLNLFHATEKYLKNHKSYKDNYLHITLGFSKSDMITIEKAPNKTELLANLAQEYIKYYTAGYNLDDEVIAYAEAHEPKESAKFNELGKERLSHIHIAIALYNPQTDKQLRPPFFNMSRDKAFTQIMCDKFMVEIPHAKVKGREKAYKSRTAEKRAFFKAQFANMSAEAVKEWLDSHKYAWRVVKTGKNHYLKVTISDEGKPYNVNLQGRGFEHINLETPHTAQERAEAHEQTPHTARFDFEKWYEKRNIEIEKARQAHQKHIKRAEAHSTKRNSIESFQNKVFYKIYKTALNRDLKGYYIDTKANQTTFKAKAQGVDVVDSGNKLTAQGENIDEQIALMIDIAIAKGWNLREINIKGSDEFKAKCNKQINAYLIKEYEQNKGDYTAELQKRIAKLRRIKANARPMNELDTMRQNLQKYDLKQLKAISKNELKEALITAKIKYDERQLDEWKGSSIDFCAKKCGMTFSAACEMLTDYLDQKAREIERINAKIAAQEAQQLQEQRERLSKIPIDDVRLELDTIAFYETEHPYYEKLKPIRTFRRVSNFTDSLKYLQGFIGLTEAESLDLLQMIADKYERIARQNAAREAQPKMDAPIKTHETPQTPRPAQKSPIFDNTPPRTIEIPQTPHRVEIPKTQAHEPTHETPHRVEIPATAQELTQSPKTPYTAQENDILQEFGETFETIPNAKEPHAFKSSLTLKDIKIYAKTAQRHGWSIKIYKNAVNNKYCILIAEKAEIDKLELQKYLEKLIPQSKFKATDLKKELEAKEQGMSM